MISTASKDSASVPSEIRRRFERDGFVAPLRAIESEEAASIRTSLAEHENRHGPLSREQHNNPHLLFTWADRLVRDPRITDRVAELYGEDLLVWGSTLFIKPPHHPGFVSWHQDSTYWGLDPADVVTAWVALSDSHADNGALCVVPGSHLQEQLAHRDTFDPDNMLSRGQEISVEVHEDESHCIELNPGEMSLHHVRMVHGSGPNTSDRPRIGFAIRYLPTRVRQIGAVRDTATLARGIDRFENFDPEVAPESDFAPEAVVFHDEVEERLKKIILQ
ncbi:phytanoyl-CoA dioxygenase family protein [Tsuneonella mangrovi]|uniref:phytanoyl-CoA dioxygenase family protein n=1 Tax=Tsuneonella mangrovi TaxID=1982042 RepID=UPI000BA2B000|nr:phytanoyl-CoA dioxygenase family protein [Tsuneonella mangrovi]